MKIYTSKIIKSTTALTLLLSLTGCYIERDVSTLKPWRAQAQQKTIVVEIPFFGINQKIDPQFQRKLKDAVDLTAAQTKNFVYARIKVNHFQKNTKNPIQDPRIKKIFGLLKQYGVDQQRIEVIQDETLKFSSSNPSTSLWIGIDRYDIKPMKCPGFDRQIMDGRTPPEGESQFGCISESNLVAMIAEPKDLHHGQNLEDDNSELLSKAIERLKTDKVKDLKIEKIASSSSAG